MSNLPYTFTIACARPKNRHKDALTGKTRYGCYPAGFLEFAREILVRGDKNSSIWHIPGGCAHEYFVGNGYSGAYGKNDLRIDIDETVKPDIIFDVRLLDRVQVTPYHVEFRPDCKPTGDLLTRPDSIIIDRDYSQDDAAKRADSSTWPEDLEYLTRHCLRIVKEGCYVGVLDLRSPRLSKDTYMKAFQIPIMLPDGSRQRLFTVWRIK